MIIQFWNYLCRNSYVALAWTVLILVLCSLPGKSIPDAPTGTDKFFHVALFAGFAFLWLIRYPKKALLILSAGILYGIAIEFYQKAFIPGRSFDVWDAAADAGGAVIGYAVYLLTAQYLIPRLNQS